MKPVAFGSCSFDDIESKYHYFTGKVAAGRYAIGQNSQFLWGCFFYWICDCTAVKEMINSRSVNKKPTFLKNDWSAEGTGCILMQPSDEKGSKKIDRTSQKYCRIFNLPI